MEKKLINLSLNLAEVNNILKVLGRMPYEEVYDLIGKIQNQAAQQMQPQQAPQAVLNGKS